MTMISPEELNTLDTLAKRLYAAKVFPKTVESVDMAFAILLAGHELGFSPMASARGITLVSGKVSLGADFTVAACTKHRDVCRYFSIIESSATQATYETHREGAPKPVALTYTHDMARRAGLTGSQTWRAHPEAMLRARCAAALARSTYPDLVGGCYDTDEAAEIRGEHGREAPATTAQEPPQRPANPLEGRGIEAPASRPQNAAETPAQRDHIREATAYVGGDNPTLGEHNRAVAEAQAMPAVPAWRVALDTLFADAPHLVVYCNDVEALTLPGDAAPVWRSHRDAIGAMSKETKGAAWKAIVARVESLGQKSAAAWLTKGVKTLDAQTDAPAATEVQS